VGARPIFLRGSAAIILALTIVLWFLSSFPAPPEGATGPAIQYSLPACWAMLQVRAGADRLQLADQRSR
jgi:Fe2+ transport system protein B